MIQSAIIEVIIGVIFIYILLSLLVSQINTVIANVFMIRAKQLRTRVEEIVFDDEVQRKLLAHPLVGIVKPPKNDEDARKNKQETAPVTKVAPQTFAKAMINLLSDPFLEVYSALALVEDRRERLRLQSILNQLKANVNDPTRTSGVLTQFHEAILALEPDDREDRRALLRTLGPLQSSIRSIQSGNSGLLSVLDKVSRVDNRAFQQAMETVLIGVNNVKEAEDAIEDWFDKKLAQTSDLYARTMGYLSLFVGLLIAVLLNIDSLHITRTLWNDPALRERLSVAARTADFDDTEFMVPQSADSADQEVIPLDEAAFDAAQETLEQLLELRLPIGWYFRPVPADAEADAFYDPNRDGRNLYNMIPGLSPDWVTNITNKVAGLLITAFAVAQGAPFWFDILRRISGSSSDEDNQAEDA